MTADEENPWRDTSAVQGWLTAETLAACPPARPAPEPSGDEHQTELAQERLLYGPGWPQAGRWER